MSLDMSFLAPLFELSRDAVIGVENATVAFANPAAARRFDAVPGQPETACLPEELTGDPAERFAAAGTFRGREYDAAVTRSGSASLYVFTAPRETDADEREPLLRVLGDELMTLRLAMDGLAANRSALKDEERKYAALLYRSYYQVKRLHSHLSIASSLKKDRPPIQMRLLSPGEVFAGVCATADRLIRSDKGVTVRYEEPKSCPPILGDERLLETLLFNLLSNSLLHTEPGDVIRVSLTPQGNRVMLAVDDSGTGAPADRLAGIFGGSAAPDLTDTAAGAGLGLVVVRSIAAAHGGAVMAESLPDRGTRVRVSLPAARSEDSRVLGAPPPSYRADGMDAALTELSTVLDKSFYTQKLMD